LGPLHSSLYLNFNGGKDKIVLGAMILILEAIFDPSFLTHAHGFRPGKGCHTALKEIKRTFPSVNWFLKGNISKCFDIFDHKLLLQLISKRIEDKGFIDLLHKALKSDYMNQEQIFSSDMGTPHGYNLRPILCNILLHDLDVFVLDLQKDFEVQDINIDFRLHNDSSYKKLKYVRFADEFLIGINGNRADCVMIKNKIANFLLNNFKLKLNFDKTKIINAKDEDAYFLKTKLIITPLDKRPLRMAPITKLVNILTEKGLAKQGGKPTRSARFLHYETHQIVKHFKQIWLRLSTYYFFADNYSELEKIHYILKYSCIFTLASKLKLKTAKKVICKFGRKILIRDKENNIIASFPNYL
jgi:hypothetical protein